LVTERLVIRFLVMGQGWIAIKDKHHVFR